MISEHAALTAIVAGQVFNGTVDRMGPALAGPKHVVDIAKSLVDEAIRRDGEEIVGRPLGDGELRIDFFSSQLRDGSDRAEGVSVEWKRGALSPEEAKDIGHRLQHVLQRYVDQSHRTDLHVDPLTD